MEKVSGSAFVKWENGGLAGNTSARRRGNVPDALPQRPHRRASRPRTADVREVVNGVLYVLRSGCDWRILPHDLPPHDTVYGYFRDWQRTGAWEGMHDTLRERGCVKRGREPSPSAAIIHSQRVKTTGKGAARPRRGQEDQRTQAA